MKFRCTILCPILVGLSLATVLAVRPKSWLADTYEEFLDGKASGVSITYDGRLVPAPTLQERWDAGTPFVLCAMRDAKGNLLAGTGHEGKVFRIDAAGKAEVFFDAGEPDVFALAQGPGDVVYAAAGTAGRVYRVTPDGKGEALPGLDAKYAWSLAVDRQGTLYAGTGTDGKIYRFRDGKAEVFYDSAETHILALVFDPDGNLLAGTAPSGFVLRITPDGKATTLFDAPHGEVRQLVRDRYGNLLVLGVGTDAEEASSAVDSATDPFSSTYQLTPRKKKKVGMDDYLALGYGAAKPAVSGLYQLDPELNVRVLWSSPEFKAFSAAVDEGGDVYLGTGDRGRILLVRDNRPYGVLVETGQEQVTAMVPHGEAIALFTSNAGKCYQLLRKPDEKGEYVTDAGDAGFPAKFGALTAQLPAAVPPGRFEFWFRCGNSPEPDNTWGAWAGPLDPVSGAAPAVPPSRYFQVKVLFRPEGNLPGAAVDTWIERLGVTFLQQNQSPRLSAFTVNPSGICFQEQTPMPNTTGIPSFGDHSSLVFPDALLAAITRPTVLPTLVKAYRLGTLSLNWTASDPNDDVLEYAVSARKLGNDAWEPLQDGIRENTLNLGINRLGEGRFQFRLTVTDAASNLPGQAREESMVSRVITIDNTSPVVRPRAGRSDRGQYEADFEVEDALSPIYLAEYSVDGGVKWTPAGPVDGICDSPREVFRVSVPAGAAGRMLIFRAMDGAANVSVATHAMK